MNMKRFVVPGAVLAGALIVAGAVFFVERGQPSTGSGQGDPTALRPVGPDDHILGNPAATIRIVEYSDFDCNFCKQFHRVLHEALDAYGASGKVAWVYRNFPLTDLHPNAAKHAEAAECVAAVAGNAAYWKFADLLFKNQPADPATYGALAESIGVDTRAFASCLADTTAVDNRIKADNDNALTIGALGTPYSVILAPGLSPVVLPGATSYATLKEQLDKLLSRTE